MQKGIEETVLNIICLMSIGALAWTNFIVPDNADWGKEIYKAINLLSIWIVLLILSIERLILRISKIRRLQ